MGRVIGLKIRSNSGRRSRKGAIGLVELDRDEARLGVRDFVKLARNFDEEFAPFIDRIIRILGGEAARRLTPDGYFGAPNPIDPELWRHFDETARNMAAALSK